MRNLHKHITKTCVLERTLLWLKEDAIKRMRLEVDSTKAAFSVAKVRKSKGPKQSNRLGKNGIPPTWWLDRQEDEQRDGS